MLGLFMPLEGLTLNSHVVLRIPLYISVPGLPISEDFNACLPLLPPLSGLCFSVTDLNMHVLSPAEGLTVLYFI